MTMASSENDTVRVFVSLTNRERTDEVPVKGADMQRVWTEHLSQIMPGNVEIEYGGSPVRKVYETLENADKAGSQDTYTVYSDPEDTSINYPVKNRLRYFPRLHAEGLAVFAAEVNPEKFTRGVGTPDVSGTSLRAALGSGNLEEFTAGMPAGVDAAAIFDILRPKAVTEAVLRALIRSIL